MGHVHTYKDKVPRLTDMRYVHTYTDKVHRLTDTKHVHTYKDKVFERYTTHRYEALGNVKHSLSQKVFTDDSVDFLQVFPDECILDVDGVKITDKVLQKHISDS